MDLEGDMGIVECSHCKGSGKEWASVSLDTGEVDRSIKMEVKTCISQNLQTNSPAFIVARSTE